MSNYWQPVGDKVTRDLYLSEEYEDQNQEVKTFSLQDKDEDLLERIEDEIEHSVNRDGIESLYGKNDYYVRLQSLLGRPLFNGLERRLNGEEGFVKGTVDFIKKTIRAIIEAFKSFFRWVLNLFSTKGKGLVREIDHLMSINKDNRVTKEKIVPSKRVLMLCFPGENPLLFRDFGFVINNLKRTKILVDGLKIYIERTKKDIKINFKNNLFRTDLDLNIPDMKNVQDIVKPLMESFKIPKLPYTMLFPGYQEYILEIELDNGTYSASFGTPNIQTNPKELDETPLYTTNVSLNKSVLEIAKSIAVELDSLRWEFAKISSEMESAISHIEDLKSNEHAIKFALSTLKIRNNQLINLTKGIIANSYGAVEAASYLVSKSIKG